MARIALTTFGTAGDVNPYVALAIGLRARGHEVVFAVEEGLRAAAFTADLLSIPLVTLALTPAAIPSAWISPQPLPLRLPPGVQHQINRATWALGQQVTARIVDPPLNRACAGYGLRPRKNWMGVGGSGGIARLVAVAVSSALCPRPPDWPAIVREIGFLFWGHSGAWHLPAELDALLAAGRPTVAVSCGSMALDMPHAFDEFYRESIAAVRAAGACALVLGAPPGALPDDLPPDVCALPFAPFSEIYPRCSAVIHHGGVGTAAQALRAGVPQLVVPWVLDQFWTAEQIQRIGAGLALRSRRYSEGAAAALLRQLLDGRRYRETCASLAARIGAEDGVATLCDALAEVLTGPTGRS